MSITYYCSDAAADIADLIEQEKDKERSSSRMRDKHRATTSIIAYKEALRIVLLERECAAHGDRQPMPDVGEYLQSRKTPPTV